MSMLLTPNPLLGKALVRLAQRDDPIYARLGAPDFAWATEELAHARRGARQREDRERLPLRVEAHQRIRHEVAQPDDCVVVHVDRVCLRMIAGQPPFAPRPRRRIVDRDLDGVPLADPDPTMRVGPDAARALA